MPQIDIHPSVDQGSLEREAIESLRANRIDPKLLYASPRQAELWREVFLQHSPIHTNPEFARIYRDASARVIDLLRPGKIRLVGLGCGTGMKEMELCTRLKSSGREVLFSAIDVSRDLVAESVEKLIAAGAEHERSLVCDLAEADFLAEWLGLSSGDFPRLYTFFGLVPNLAPSMVIRLFRSLLRPGDVLLASAHLMPLGDDNNYAKAMHAVLPQYDNAETLAWLRAALDHWQLTDWLNALGMQIDSMEGVPAFVARARWKSSEPFDFRGHRLSPKAEEPLRVFHSLRYTPALFEKVLGREGLRAERLAMTNCREEAIWAVRRDSAPG